MVEGQTEDQVPGVGVDEGGQVDGAVDRDDYSDEDDDEDLTTDGCGVALAAAVQQVPSFGSVSVNNSTDIHFGNKTVYQGPVTIKQVVYASGKETVEDGFPDMKVVEGAGPGPQTRPVTPDVNKAGSHDLKRRDALKLCLGQATRRRRCLLWLVTLGLFVFLAVSLTLLLVIVRRTDLDPSRRHTGELTYNQPRTRYDVTLSGKLRILGRSDWLAQPATHPVDRLELPVPYVIISHTATDQCHSQAQCVYIVRITQTFHIESKGWSDIGYNFLVGGDGYVYTGRGWDAVGAHAYGFNTCSIGITFIGTFISDHPSPSQLLAATQLVDEGVRLGKISPDYKLLGHRQVSATESPGQALFEDITAHPHWLEVPLPCADTSKLATHRDVRLPDNSSRSSN